MNVSNQGIASPVTGDEQIKYRPAHFVLVIIVALLGLFLLWAIQDPPLPKKARAKGNAIYIDLGSRSQDGSEANNLRFAVPKAHAPSVTESLFTFYFRYPSGTPYTGNESPVPLDSIRVVVQYRSQGEVMRSRRALSKMQPKDGPLVAVPWFLENKHGLTTYQYRVDATANGAYYTLSGRDGRTLLADDPGNWTGVYRVDREFGPHIELTYYVSKPLIRDLEHFVEDVTKVDDAVLAKLQSFQVK